MASLYTDINHYCCEWISNLANYNELPSGLSIQKDINLLTPQFLSRFTQCHFFCGIGGWPLALKLAKWPETRSAWTGSCPCQPFSVASTNAKGYTDERDLWPDWFYLIAKCRPPTIFGEQVAGKAGQKWLELTANDLESIGYRFAAASLQAHCVGALHERNRFYWVADSAGTRLERYEYKLEELCSVKEKASAQHCNDGLSKKLLIRPDPASTSRVDGLSRPVDIVRAFGNAIVPAAACEFVKAYMEALL